MCVGLSTTGVRKRIEQHYSDGHSGTYDCLALKLQLDIHK